MTLLYLDAQDNAVDFTELGIWFREMMPYRYSFRYLSDVGIWEFAFKRANDAMLFKLTWGAK